MLDISGFVDGRVQIAVVLKYLKRLMGDTQVIVCSGNHDLDSRNQAGEKVARWMDKVRGLGIPTDGDSLALGDILFTICPWWDGPVTREAVAEQFARDAAKPKKSWIWVYHSPPEGSPTSRTRERSFGDKDLTGWIETFHPTSCSRGISTRRRSTAPAAGRTGWDRPGSSTRAGRSARRRPIS